MKSRLSLMFVCGALGLLALTACGGNKDAVKNDAKAQTAARHVETLKVKQETLSSYFEATGTALPIRESLLACEVPGIVERLLAHRGDRVKKGQALLQLGSRDYELAIEQASAGLAAATAAADQMKLDFERITKLRDSDATAVANYERMKAQFDATAAQKKLAEVGLKRAQKALADSTLRAPYDGSIVMTLIQEGEYAPSMPPTMLMKIVDASVLEVQAHLTEDAARLVKKGDKAEIEVDSAGVKTSGEISFISDRIDSGVQTFETRIKLDNKDGAIKAGAFVRIRIPRESKGDAILIPTRAISRDENGVPSVFVLNGGKAEKRGVKLGVTSGSSTQVAEGLKLGEELITSQVNVLLADEAVTADNRN